MNAQHMFIESKHVEYILGISITHLHDIMENAYSKHHQVIVIVTITEQRIVYVCKVVWF